MSSKNRKVTSTHDNRNVILLCLTIFLIIISIIVLTVNYDENGNDIDHNGKVITRTTTILHYLDTQNLRMQKHIF